ncbi:MULTISPECIES: MEDS domain-containing protein [Halorussus]|uniref:MEDS domain-containing protein n=1 Tax=Halorussus TaxID=1070314 RepID=UPI00209D9577|nr:MEDS domain-containing protein [Halorussus vallis]USZ73877.1 MEDS domain-containing protein [Halorussus vallis]
MSERASPTAETDDVEYVESAVEALRSSRAFRGPAEPIENHDHANGHFALVYDSRKEQFAAVAPFVRQGLERGERCLYVAGENSREDVEEAMRDHGVDVDAALESGQLSIHDERETYLRNETFDADETVEFIDAAIEEATEEYEGLRMAGEMSTVLREDPEGEELVRCEAKANYLFDDADGIALCQYNRNLFPSEVIRDVISTHPLLVHDGRISHNVYYTPPGEFFGPEKSEREVERLLGSLGEQTDAEVDRRQRERFLRESYRITADPALDFEQKLQQLFDLGCEQFGLELGAMAKVDPDADRFEVEHVSADHEHFAPGLELPLPDTDHTAAADADAVESVGKPDGYGYDVTVGGEFGFETYLGTYIEVKGDLDRTFFFVSEEPRREPFSDNEHLFQRLLGQWVNYELERRQRERELRERTEHLSALVETTPECIKTVDADGTLLQMNTAGLEMVEADAESDVIGESVYGLVAPEHRERFREFNERICRGERGTMEFDIVGLEGTRRHMETHAAPLHLPDGTTAHVALTRDITDRVERERRLEETVEELEESNERLESFASMLAHELRNPVAIGQIYGQRLPDESDSEAVEYVTEAFDRIEEMIDVMLVLTRGREAVGDRTAVDLAAVAREAWGDVHAPDATLDVAVDRTIRADEAYVRQLFRNLLENAVEHGADRPRPDDDRDERDGRGVSVTVGRLPTGFYVADDGRGVPVEDRETIFEPGYTTASENGGTGLGLAFVRKLVSVYGWDCRVTESEAGGARFEFRDVV